jgi:PEP-CTERM motif-containing protein
LRDSIPCEGDVQMKKTQWMIAALPVVGALTFAARAQAGIYNLTFGGDGNVSGSITVTVGADPKAGADFGTPKNLVPSGPGFVGIADPLNASLITAVTGGVFSDAALGITKEKVTGLVANNHAPHFAPDQTIPYSFSYYTALDPKVSYDNLFYTDGSSPQTCTFPPPGNYGGFLDNYGVMFTLANGDVVDLYSNGYIQAVGNPPVTPGPHYGVVVDVGGVPNYDSADGLGLSTPEPSTWAMMVLGFASLGFAGYRASRKAGVVAA